jgi:hypothetical protein
MKEVNLLLIKLNNGKKVLCRNVEEFNRTFFFSKWSSKIDAGIFTDMRTPTAIQLSSTKLKLLPTTLHGLTFHKSTFLIYSSS